MRRRVVLFGLAALLSVTALQPDPWGSSRPVVRFPTGGARVVDAVADGELLLPGATRAELVRLETGLAVGKRSELAVRFAATPEARARVGLSETPVVVDYRRGAMPEKGS